MLSLLETSLYLLPVLDVTSIPLINQGKRPRAQPEGWLISEEMDYLTREWRGETQARVQQNLWGDAIAMLRSEELPLSFPYDSFTWPRKLSNLLLSAWDLKLGWSDKRRRSVKHQRTSLSNKMNLMGLSGMLKRTPGFLTAPTLIYFKWIRSPWWQFLLQKSEIWA